MPMQITNVASIRQNNLRTLLIAIHKYGPISKRELQKITSLSWGSVSAMVEELYNLNYIVTIGKSEGSVGRRATNYAINVNINHIIGIDLNASGITAVLTDLCGKTIKQIFRPLSLLTYDNVMDTLFDITSEMISSEPSEKNILGIGIAAQGIIDSNHGISIFFPQISGWKDVHLCEIFEKKFGIRTFVIHDPDCIMVAERTYGLGRNKHHHNVALVRLEKGIGLSLAINGTISTGNYISELGHICVNYNGPRCVCGNNGCLEEYASSDGMLRRYYEVSKAIYDPNINFMALALMAMEGDEICLGLFSDMSKYLGTAFSTLANLFPIDSIILYGSMIQARKLFENQINEYMNKHIYGNKKVSILYSDLDITAPALGAALWVSDIIINSMTFDRN
ncbi:MAG: ROK family protein [Eubacteriales bacterium]